MPVSLASQKLDHGYVIGEGGGGADDFVEIRRKGKHLLKRFVELLSTSEVVKGKNQGRSRT